MPPAGTFDTILQALFWFPAQRTSGQFRTGDKSRRIAWPAWVHLGTRPAIVDFPARSQHFGHGVALPGAEVEDVPAIRTVQVGQRAQMRIAQVFHMDVVANAGLTFQVFQFFH